MGSEDSAYFHTFAHQKEEGEGGREAGQIFDTERNK